jgi:hypothetical protein
MSEEAVIAKKSPFAVELGARGELLIISEVLPQTDEP